MKKFFSIVAASIGLAACPPAYVAAQQGDFSASSVLVLNDEQWESAASAKPAITAKLMDCKPFAPRGTRANEDAFTRCTLVNERTQALAEAKAAREELARVKAEAARRPSSLPEGRWQGFPPGGVVAPSIAPPMQVGGASTRQPQDMVGVASFRTRGIVYDTDADSYRVCVFRDGAPVSIEVGGTFLPTLADTTGDGRIDGSFDCAPYGSYIYVINVRPRDVLQFIYVRPVSRGATNFEGKTYNGYYLRRRLCEVTGQNGPMDFASFLLGCGS